MPSCRTAVRGSVVALGLTVASGLAAAAAAAPVPVAPGAPGRMAPASGGCPTFSWTADAAAPGYELVVFPADASAATSDEPVLSEVLPAGATSWTPAADRCLEPGGYGWSVRTAGARGRASWSEASLFRVPAPASAGTDPFEALAASLGDGLAPEDLARGLRLLAARSRAAEASASPREESSAPADAAAAAGSPLAPRATAPGGLRVSGNVVTSGDFAYPVPRPVLVNLGAAEFQTRRTTEERWSLDRDGYGFIFILPSGGLPLPVELMAPVRLPEGAIVTLFFCQYQDNDVDDDATLTFRLRRRSGPVSEVVAAVSETTSGSSVALIAAATTAISGAVINNQVFTYWIEGSWSSTSASTSLRFYGCSMTAAVPALVP